MSACSAAVDKCRIAKQNLLYGQQGTGYLLDCALAQCKRTYCAEKSKLDFTMQLPQEQKQQQRQQQQQQQQQQQHKQVRQRLDNKKVENFVTINYIQSCSEIKV